MRTLIPLIGALGLALVATGLPPLRRPGLAERVEPHLNGLGGKAALRPPAGLRPQGLVMWMQSVLAPRLPGGGPLLTRRLEASGTGMTVTSFRAEQMVWSAAALCCTLTTLLLVGRPSLGAMTALGSLAAVTGAAARDWRLSRETARRRERVRQEMPVAIDLLTLAIMAGEGVPAAFERVSALLGGDVASEFRRVVGSIRAGVPVSPAIHELGERIPHPSAGRLADCLTVAIDRGAPLAEALRAQADDLRDARRRDLLEMGGRREIAMLVPVIFLILPVTVAFVLLPGLVSLDLVVL